MLTEAEPRPVLAAVSDDPHSATATHAPSAPLRGHRPADPTAFDEPAPPNAIRSWFHPGAKIHEDSGAKTLDDTHVLMRAAPTVVLTVNDLGFDRVQLQPD